MFRMERVGSLDVLTVPEQWKFFADANYETPGQFVGERREVGLTMGVRCPDSETMLFRVARCTPYGSQYMVGLIPA